MKYSGTCVVNWVRLDKDLIMVVDAGAGLLVWIGI